MPRANATTDHETIRRWVEARKGHPTFVKATEGKRGGSGGLLRIDFAKPDAALDEVSWDEFFDTFDENNLAFLYQDTTASGRKSRFNKFVSRDKIDTQDTEEDQGSPSRRASGSNGQASSQRATQEEAEEIDEEDAMDEDEDFTDDEDEEQR